MLCAIRKYKVIWNPFIINYLEYLSGSQAISKIRKTNSTLILIFVFLNFQIMRFLWVSLEKYKGHSSNFEMRIQGFGGIFGG